MLAQMNGHLSMAGRMLAGAGFMHAGFAPAGFDLGPSMPVYNRGAGFSPQTREFIEGLGKIERGEVTGDIDQILGQLGTTFAEFQRAITSSTSNLPIRENLEAEAKILVPVETPVRNLLPRSMGSGTASAWRTITALGGGWGSSLDQPGGGSALRMFFSESGAPADHATSYANTSKSYKLLGTYGSITGLAMAAGANFQNQLAMEKTNAIRNLMLNEEYALIAGDSSSTSAPWGDGSATLAFDGLTNLITTGNGTPSAQVQSAVGALTLSHIDNQLARLWAQGGQVPYMIMNKQEVLSLVHLAEASGSIIRVSATATADAILGVAVTGYKHPISGDIVPILPSRFLASGTIIFGTKYLPDGSPSADVQVLPQVQLPELAPTDMVQGYVAQELAPTIAAPQVYPFVVTVYEVLRMKSYLHFAKSTSVTAV